MGTGCTTCLDSEQAKRAAALHEEAIVIDGSVVIRFDDRQLAEVKTGGITASNHTVTDPGRGIKSGLKQIVKCLQWIESNADRVMLILKADDILRAKREGKYGVILGPQDTDIIEDDLDLVDAFWGLGIRIMQLTYQAKNLVGCGCGAEKDEGLSAFGKQVVDRMNEMGMVIDLSHVGPVTTMEAIERSSRPALFTHTHAKALAGHPRCKTDDLIKLLAARGGVMGITAYSPIFAVEDGQRPTVEDVVDHVIYVADLVGIDHVAIGLDHDETSTPERFAAFRAAHPELTRGFTWEARRAKGIERLSMMPNVTSCLVARGFSDEDIKKVLGLNFLRVFRDNWG